MATTLSHPTSYRDLQGRSYDLTALGADERELIHSFLDRYAAGAEWNEFDNFWMAAVSRYAAKQNLSRTAAQQTVAYRIGQDLGNRVGIDAGYIRMPSDYRDDLIDLLREFKTRREFCQATGLSEDMLSHVLAKRKQLGIDTLANALARIGYELKIVPMQRPQEPTPTATH